MSSIRIIHSYVNLGLLPKFALEKCAVFTDFLPSSSKDLHCYIPVSADRESCLFIETCDQLPVLVRPGISEGREFIAVRGR